MRTMVHVYRKAHETDKHGTYVNLLVCSLPSAAEAEGVAAFLTRKTGWTHCTSAVADPFK